MRTTVNYSEKNIREFTPEDTIYISRIEGGYQIIYFCKFVKFEKGMVYGKAISAEPTWAFHKSEAGREVKAKVTKCFLWGAPTNSGMKHNHCNWFTREGYCNPSPAKNLL